MLQRKAVPPKTSNSSKSKGVLHVRSQSTDVRSTFKRPPLQLPELQQPKCNGGVGAIQLHNADVVPLFLAKGVVQQCRYPIIQLCSLSDGVVVRFQWRSLEVRSFKQAIILFQPVRACTSGSKDQNVALLVLTSPSIALDDQLQHCLPPVGCCTGDGAKRGDNLGFTDRLIGLGCGFQFQCPGDPCDPVISGWYLLHL